MIFTILLKIFLLYKGYGTCYLKDVYSKFLNRNFKTPTCKCIKGRTGELCEKIGSEKTCPNECNLMGKCTDGKCRCKYSNFKSEHNCGKSDHCLTNLNNCNNNGVCIGWICSCNDGYSGNSCLNFKQFLGGPEYCVNGIVSFPTERNYSCRCIDGWTGTVCDKRIKK